MRSESDVIASSSARNIFFMGLPLVDDAEAAGGPREKQVRRIGVIIVAGQN
jgi:hypothetical protein